MNREDDAMRRIMPLMTRWLDATEQCQNVVSGLVKDPDHRVQVDFLAAKVALLFGHPTTAMNILDDLLQRAPDQVAPNMTLPIAVVANLWKGTIARHSGDFEAARAAYASVMAKAEKFPREKPFLQMMSAIYLAEIEAASSRREDMMKQLEAAKAVERPKDMPEVHTFYTDWARFQVMVAKDGPDSVQEALKGDEKRLRALSFVPFYHFLLTGIGTEPGTGLFDDNRLYMRALELAAENRTSPIDRSLAFLLLGGCADRRKELDRAASAYRRLFESDSFLAPDSGILLLRLLKRQGKEDEATAVKEAIEKRFPGYKELADKPVGTR